MLSLEINLKQIIPFGDSKISQDVFFKTNMTAHVIQGFDLTSNQNPSPDLYRTDAKQ